MRCTPSSAIVTLTLGALTASSAAVATCASPTAGRSRFATPRAAVSLSSTEIPRTPEDFVREASTVLEETLEVVRDVGLESTVKRTLVGQRAFLATALELSRELPLPTPLTPGARADEWLTSYFTSLPSELAPRTLRKLFERLGATYVKLGQFIASSPTLFPADYVLEFQKCLDSSPTVPYETIKRIVESELNMPLERAFASFERQPLASASVAQVHAARLPSGEDVVVKVQKPGVGDVLKADLGFIAVASRLLQFVAPSLGRLSLAGIVSDLRTTMLGELDFRQEAENLEEFSRFLRSAGLTDVATCPLPYRELCSQRVLTMQRLYGVPLTDPDGIRGYAANPEQTLINALNTWSLSVVAAPFFHADVHAGNLLVLTDGRIGFIDFGIVGRIPPSIWDAVQQLGTGLGTEDWEAVAGAMVQMGATSGTVNQAQLARDIAELASRARTIDPQLVATVDAAGDVRAQVSVDNEAVTRLAIEIADVAERAGVKLPREFGLLVKQALYFDRYTKALAPELDVLADDRISLGDMGTGRRDADGRPGRGGSRSTPADDDDSAIDI